MIRIYLAGKVAKGNEIGNIEDWRKRYADIMISVSEEELLFLDPEDESLDESDSMEIVGHDCSQIKDCDVVIVNAEKKLGVGTAQEMVVAKYFNKCVVSLIPDNSHYCRRNLNMYGNIIEKWIHPFMKIFSDVIFSDLGELQENLPLIFQLLRSGEIKDISTIDEVCEYYQSKKK